MDLVDRVGCPVEALGEDSRSQAHRAVVAHFNGILQVLEGHNWQNRPEDFVLNSGTFLGDVGQNGWFVEEALAFHWLTTNNDLGPFLNGLLDLAVDLFEGRLVNQRAHANVRVLNGVTSGNGLNAGNQLLHELIGHAFLNVNSLNVVAQFTVVVEPRTNDVLNGFINVGIITDDCWRIPT